MDFTVDIFRVGEKEAINKILIVFGTQEIYRKYVVPYRYV